jgi:hypothetical protein
LKYIFFRSYLTKLFIHFSLACCSWLAPIHQFRPRRLGTPNAMMAFACRSWTQQAIVTILASIASSDSYWRLQLLPDDLPHNSLFCLHIWIDFRHQPRQFRLEKSAALFCRSRGQKALTLDFLRPKTCSIKTGPDSKTLKDSNLQFCFVSQFVLIIS